MDMFMDKLAQKLNAQEIIKANTTAETEEMNKLKNQIAEYHQCLARLKKLVEAGEAAAREVQSGREDMERLTEESLQKIRDIRSETGELQKLAEEMKRLEEEIAELGRGGEGTTKAVRSTEKSLQEKLETLQASVEENVHKECVKVYRNVQAVVTEESEKQGKAAEETREAVKAVSGKIGTVLGISVAALILSLAGVALQVLNLFHISLF